jgi:predicted phosphoribosyltransferase
MRGQTVLLVDDGLATGTTMRAAIAAVRAQRPAALVVAVPVAASESLAALRPLVDALFCVLAPESLYAIGLWYEDFSQTTDAEVCALLERAAERVQEPLAASQLGSHEADTGPTKS